MKLEPAAMIDACEAVLASHIVELTTEFRGYDAVDLIALIRLGRLPALRSLLESDCDSLFKPTTMSFGGDADVSMSWSAPPTIRFAMEFRHLGIEIFYRLTLAAAEACVQIDLVRGAGSGASAAAAQLDRVLWDARAFRDR